MLNYVKNHLQLDVDDIDGDDITHKFLPSKYKFATKNDILKAIEFSKKYKVHIIHCGAGLSRSPALAYAIFRSQGMDKETAMNEVIKIQPLAIPNKWIVKLTDEIFDGGINKNI